MQPIDYYDALDIIADHDPVRLDPECQWYYIEATSDEIGPEGECDRVWAAFEALAEDAGVGTEEIDFVTMWDGERLRVVFAVERPPVVQLRLF